MEAIYLTKENEKIWDDFAYRSSSAWFRHTTAWLKYSSCCRFDSNTQNHSFMVMQGGKIYAIVPFLSEYSYPERIFDCIAMYGDYTPLPAFVDDSDIDIHKIETFISDEVEKIINENHLKYGKFFIDPLIQKNYINDFGPYNLLNFGAISSLSSTNLIDLSLDISEILRSMRKGHKAAVKQSEKMSGYRVDIYDKDNIARNILLTFKDIHKFDAGRQTRTNESWECMYEWIQSGMAILSMLWIDEINAYGAGALIMCYKTEAYYCSYATLDSSFINGHCGTIIQWTTIKYLKEHGYLRYEMGRNDYTEHNNDDKLYAIAKYKKGYCNVEVPLITYRKDFY